MARRHPSSIPLQSRQLRENGCQHRVVPAGGTFFHWPNMKPFVLRSADQFRSDDPPALTSARSARDYNEVKAVGGMTSALRPQDRTDVARFYAATSPVGVWNPITRQLSIAAGDSLSENARAFAPELWPSVTPRWRCSTPSTNTISGGQRQRFVREIWTTTRARMRTRRLCLWSSPPVFRAIHWLTQRSATPLVRCWSSFMRRGAGRRATIRVGESVSGWSSTASLRLGAAIAGIVRIPRRPQ